MSDRCCTRWLATLALILSAPSAWSQGAPADPVAGRNLAATCANCHGTNGQARGDVRALAGVPAQELVAALSAYKSGSRPGTIMNQIAKGYSDEQLRLIADHFAAQQPAKR